jgi:hypothetical protein
VLCSGDYSCADPLRAVCKRAPPPVERDRSGAEQARPEPSSTTRAQCSSRFIGVYWHKHRRDWCVFIYLQGVQIYVGSFENEEDAARAYDGAARMYSMLNHVNLPSERGNAEGGADPSSEEEHPAAADPAATTDPPSVSIRPGQPNPSACSGLYIPFVCPLVP